MRRSLSSPIDEAQQGRDLETEFQSLKRQRVECAMRMPQLQGSGPAVLLIPRGLSQAQPGAEAGFGQPQAQQWLLKCAAALQRLAHSAAAAATRHIGC